MMIERLERRTFLNAGDLDTTFSGDGKLLEDFGPGDNQFTDVAVLSSGRILVTGWFGNGTTSSRGGFLARYNADGSTDSTFGTQGVLGLGSTTQPNQLILRPGGSVIISGALVDGRGFIGKLSAQGSFTNLASSAHIGSTVDVQSDGRFISATTSTVYRFNANGTADTTFHSIDLIANTELATVTINDVTVTPANKILVTGYGTDDANNILGADTAVLRLTSDGDLDTSFSGDGLQFINTAAFEFGLKSIVQPDAKILVLIQPEDEVDAVIRLKNDGSIDATFAGGFTLGNLAHQAPGANQVTDFALAADGKIVVSGTTFHGSVPGTLGFAATRLTATGPVEQAFGDAGVTKIDFSSDNDFRIDSSTAVALTPSGNIVIVGKSVGQDSLGNRGPSSAAITQLLGKPSPTAVQITGTVFFDLNRNGIRDSSESGLSPCTVYIDTNNNQRLDAGEPRMTTADSGGYRFDGLVAGTYIVRQVVFDSYFPTSPVNGYGIHLTLTPGQHAAGKNFGQSHYTGEISGTFFDDLNGNGVREAGELTSQKRTAYIDANNNHKLDPGERSSYDYFSGGQFDFNNLAPGTYIVRQVLPTGWTQTTPRNGYGIHINLGDRQNSFDHLFGSRPTSAGTASVSGIVFRDINKNGRRDSGELGLRAWLLYIDLDNDNKLDYNEQRVETDEDGNYIFNNLGAGTYKIRLVHQGGYVQTTPANNFGNNATVAAGQKIGNKNFGVAT